MLRTIALIGCIAIASAVAWQASRTPEPQPVSASPDDFSSSRAFRDVEAIGRRAHPLGSAEHDRVRDYLIGRCHELGLEVAVIPGRAISPGAYPSVALVEGGDVQPIVCTLPGHDRTLPALALMAHYDTVPASPGAADDTAGVAIELEAARALQAEGRPLREVLLVFSDGEEDDLLGARVLFGPAGLSRRVGAVLNMDTRGGGGRAYMFETGADDAGMVREFARTAVHPTAASLTGYAYSLLPAGTDFTIARRHGVTGLNYAFIGRPFDYHAASSTPTALDLGSLQHMGEQVLAAARGLAYAPTLPRPGPDLVYADLLGGPVIVYPVWAGWLVLAAVAGGLFAAFRRAFDDEAFSWPSALKGAAALVLAALVSALALLLVRHGSGVGVGLVEEKPLAARFGLYEAALASAGLGAILVGFLAAGSWRGRFWSAFAGACAVGLGLAVALQALAPLAAYLVAGPLAVAALLAAALAFGWDGAPATWSAGAFVAVLAILPLAQLLYTAHALVLGVGAELPEAFAVFVVLAGLILFPLLWPEGARWPRWGVAGLALLAALAATLALRLVPPWSPRHPRPAEVVYVADLDHGRFLRASPLDDLDPWTARALGADGAPIRLGPLAPFARRAHVAPTAPAALPRPRLEETRSGRTVTLTLTPGGSARDLILELRPTTAISAVTVNGLPAFPALRTGRRTLLLWHAPRAPLEVSFSAPAHLALAARYAEVLDGWPPDARPPPPMPPDVMPWMDSGSTVLLGSRRYRW